MAWKMDSEMPFGKHKGDKLITLTYSYVTWLCRQEWFKGELKTFFEENIEHYRRNSCLPNNFFGGDMMSRSLQQGYM